MLKISEAKSDIEIQEVRRLFSEYATGSDLQTDAQNFEADLLYLHNRFGSPAGRMLLASFEGLPGNIGCVALKRLDNQICEMKYLYVSPPFRGMGIGRTLCERVSEMAIDIGYRRIRLAVLKNTTGVINLFRSLGFQETAAYNDSPVNETMFMELVLA